MSNKTRRIFVVADFKDESPRAVFLEERRIVKGLIRAGADVQRFAYRNILTQFNPFSGKHFRRFMPKFVRRRADAIMAEQIKYYYPDVVFFLSMKYVTPETVIAAKAAAPNALLIGRDGDPYPESRSERLAVGALMDIVLAPYGGSWLETYKKVGAKHCAFLPFTSDPDLHYVYPQQAKWKTNMTFLGAADHSDMDRDDLRYKLARRLSEMPDAKVYACFGRPKTQGLDCFAALSGAKIGLSINIANDVYLYHSDRYINIPACGAFELAKYVPGYELMLEDKKHLRYFNTEQEFFELADWYLKHEEERTKIAAAGMQHAHQEYNCTRIAKLLLDLIDKGDYDAPWKVFL